MDENLIIEFDHMDGPYYVVHVYIDVEDEFGGHTATLAWYGVDSETGNIIDALNDL